MKNDNHNQVTGNGAVRLPIVGRQEGETKMKALERISHTIGRYAVVVGSALAVACVVAIVSSPRAIEPAQVDQPAEVVRLDPVIVTISAERFDAIHAETSGSSMLVHVFGGGPKQM